MQQIMTLEMVDGTIINLRFDLGTARLVKANTGVDPIVTNIAEDWWNAAADIFVAAYQRACVVFKEKPTLTIQQLKEYYEELNMNEAVTVVRNFNGVLTVNVTPEIEAALKAAKELEQANTESVEVTNKVDEPEVKNV